MSKKVYEIITNQIIKKLENGVVPWKKPWQSGGAVNWKNQKEYRGINALLLEPGEYASKKQINEAGGKIKDGAKSEIVVYWHWYKYKDRGQENVPDDEATYTKGAKPFYYKVFDINKQVEGLQSKREIQDFKHDPIEEAEKIKENYMGGPTYGFERKGAWYMPSMDHINVPPMKNFEDINKFYSTLFHEMAHSTGHKSRLNRDGIMGTIRFGSEDYSKEELVAELGASFLCRVAGIDNTTIDNSASYIDSWLQALRNDKKLIVNASQQAQKASDYIQGIEFN